MNPDNPLGEIVRKTPFVVSLSNHERPFDRLRANGFRANGLSGMKLAMQQIIVRGSQHLFWMFVLAAFTAPMASALEIRGEQVPQNDISILPPVCKLIVVEKPGAHHGAGNAPLQEHAALFE